MWPTGADPRQRLDLHKPESRAGAPIVVFLHGGAYVRGDRSVNAEVYGNVATYFARQGMLGVNATYRLAPAAQWPAAAQDVGLLVQWLKANSAVHGGDPSRIYLLGHSAGATHVATYVYQTDLHPADGPGVAGIVLMSGRYHFDPKPDDPNLMNFQSYFGTDAGRYPAQSPINHVKTAKPLPTFIVISEYDNPDLDTQGALLLGALCESRPRLPAFHAHGAAQSPFDGLPVQHRRRCAGPRNPGVHAARAVILSSLMYRSKARDRVEHGLSASGALRKFIALARAATPAQPRAGSRLPRQRVR